MTNLNDIANRIKKCNNEYEQHVKRWEELKRELNVASMLVAQAEELMDEKCNELSARALVAAHEAQASVIGSLRDLTSDMTFALGELEVGLRHYARGIASSYGV